MTTSVQELQLRADVALSRGETDAAIAAYRALLTVAPDRPDAWYNLGYLLRVVRRFDEALDAYGHALARGAAGAEAIHVNRAAILSEHLQRDAEAEAELHAAVTVAPGFVPAWLNLGNLHEDRGDPARASEAYARALAVDPACGRAHARLAAIDIFAGNAAAARDRLARAAAQAGLAGEDRAELAFAQGAAADALRDFPAAFAAFAEANRIARLIERPGTRYDARAGEALIGAIIAAFPKPASDVPDPDVMPPIFICGMFRSGSTLVEQMLSRHSQITAGGELEFLPALVADCRPYPAAAAHADERTIAGWRARYAAEVDVRFPDAVRLTDKRPDNFLHIGLIKRLFPDARILHTRRQPLDNLLSIWSQYFADDITYSRDLTDAAHWYRQYRRLMRHWRSIYDADLHDVDYDRLVVDPEAELRAALAFLGLPWDAHCLAPESAAGMVRTASVWQVRKPLHPRSSGRWRNYAAQLAATCAALGDDAE